jgi:hypothetical protein
MARSFVLTGAHIVLYINNKVYKPTQGVSFNIDYGETEIYGIDAAYPQEIAPTRITVRGSVNGIRVKMSGGLQGENARPLFTDIAASPYISLRIHDRDSGEDILLIPNAKITRESHQIATKSTYKLSFDFVGMIPLMALDRSDD